MEEYFDHRDAYEEEGPMGQKLADLMDIAAEHGCPIMVCASTYNNEENFGLGFWKNLRQLDEDESWYPDVMSTAELILRLSHENRELIKQLLGLMMKADATEETMNQLIQESVAQASSEVSALLRKQDAN